MLVVATYTSNRRIGGDLRDGLGVLLAIFLGATRPRSAIVAVTGALDFSGPDACSPSPRR